MCLFFTGTAKFDGGGTARITAHTAATPGRCRPARRPCCATATAAATAAATTASSPAPANTRYTGVPVQCFLFFTFFFVQFCNNHCCRAEIQAFCWLRLTFIGANF